MAHIEQKNPGLSFAEAFADSAELIQDKGEFDMICRFLSHPNERITREKIFDEAVVAGMDWLTTYKLKVAFETIGFPEEDESVDLDILTPRDIEEILDSGPEESSIFNNEFRIFAFAPRKGPGDALDTIDALHMVAQFNPVKFRLRALCPRLVTTMEAYGAEHPSMSKFYGGLVENTPESRKYLTLFTVTDQLLLRLVRPADAEYMVECAKRAEAARFKEYEAPRYDELKPAEGTLVTNARRFLYT